MNLMFAYCQSLSELDLPSFESENVEKMDSMFFYCNNLSTITVGQGWNAEDVKSSQNMFLSCNKIKGENGTTYDSSHLDATYARVDTEEKPGYFTLYKGSGIGVIENVGFSNNQWLTPSGIVLKHKPKKNGTYIYNGRKVFIKQ